MGHPTENYAKGLQRLLRLAFFSVMDMIPLPIGEVQEQHAARGPLGLMTGGKSHPSLEFVENLVTLQQGPGVLGIP